MSFQATSRRLLMRTVLGRRLPLGSGTLHVKGPRAALTIGRDENGVAYIDAQNDEDAWFGLGFCQAQDRAFQLELRMRTARGTLSELVGPQTLPIDRLTRRIGLRDSSLRQLPVLDADVRAQIEAFVGGINAAYQAGLPRRPHEFVLLRAQPTPWDAADVLAAGKLMSFLLVGNWDVELARLKILLEDGEQALRDLDPSYPEGHPLTSLPGASAEAAVDRLGTDLAALIEFTGLSGGSNNWALAGSKTRSGRPILANDPHLDPALPAHWYLARLRTPEWGLAGAALVGAPAFGAGHNGFCAWGITAGLTDMVDLFVEELAEDGRGVRRGSGFEPCDIRRELIKVKGSEPVIEDVFVTPRGPVISPALGGGLPAISMRAVWLDARPARGFLTAYKATSLESFRREFEKWPVLPQNIAYADIDGHIAYQLVGELPRRRKGSGTIPLAGSDPQAGWLEGTVPFEQMPHIIDPASGFLATANNKPARDFDGPFLGVDWLDGYRASRILEALAERDDWDVRQTQLLQLDEVSLPWREIRDLVLGLDTASGDAAAGLELLRQWDGVVSADSPAAAVYEAFIGEMWRRMARSRAPRAADYALSRGFTELLPGTTFAAGRISTLLRRLREQPAGWFAAPWPAVMADALAQVMRDLQVQHGATPQGWAWGRLRQLTLEHPLGRIKPLAPVFNQGPFPFGGDGNTVSQASASARRFPTNPGAIASLRAVIDVGEWDASRFSMPGGQSGNPLSPHYADLTSLWLRGEGIAVRWSGAAMDIAAGRALRLLPLG